MSENAYLYIINCYEQKLKELMQDKEYKAFTSKVADKALEAYVIGMVDSKFMDYMMGHKKDESNRTN